jgi:hypothetical protein
LILGRVAFTLKTGRAICSIGFFVGLAVTPEKEVCQYAFLIDSVVCFTAEFARLRFCGQSFYADRGS